MQGESKDSWTTLKTLMTYFVLVKMCYKDPFWSPVQARVISFRLAFIYCGKLSGTYGKLSPLLCDRFFQLQFAGCIRFCNGIIIVTTSCINL